jgi:hypothetical protein
MKYQLVKLVTNEIITPDYITLSPNGQLYCYGIDVTERYLIRRFTGLLDKNDVEIFEGDICSTDLSRPYNVVVFRNGAFMYQCNDHDEDYFDIMVPVDETTDKDQYTKVLGNIYQNPELLEEHS